MKLIRHLDAVAELPEGEIKDRIRQELESLLESFPEVYDPAVHGWFQILETVADWQHPAWPNSPYSIRKAIEGRCFEWLGRGGDVYEMVLVINDNEAVTTYIPDYLLQHTPELRALLDERQSVAA